MSVDVILTKDQLLDALPTDEAETVNYSGVNYEIYRNSPSP